MMHVPTEVGVSSTPEQLAVNDELIGSVLGSHPVNRRGDNHERRFGRVVAANGADGPTANSRHRRQCGSGDRVHAEKSAACRRNTSTCRSPLRRADDIRRPDAVTRRTPLSEGTSPGCGCFALPLELAVTAVEVLLIYLLIAAAPTRRVCQQLHHVHQHTISRPRSAPDVAAGHPPGN